MRKIGLVHVAEPGLTAGGRKVEGRWQEGGRQVAGRWQSDEIQVNLEIFKNHCTSKDSTSCFI